MRKKNATVGKKSATTDKVTSDLEWIIEQEDKLKQILLELAKSKAPRPAADTLLGRALWLFAGD